MSGTLPPIEDLKAEAKALRQARARRGETISHGQALEHVAHEHGFRDWNTLSARANAQANSLSVQEATRSSVPELGYRIRGAYLGHHFTGRVIGVQTVGPSMRRVTVVFDTPIDVVASPHFSSYRSRVTTIVNRDGETFEKLSDGTPQLRLDM